MIDIKAGATFTLMIQVQDKTDRPNNGVISLPLHISWDPNFIELDTSILPNPPPNPLPDFPRAIPLANNIVTPFFPRQRLLENFDANAAAFPLTLVPPPVVGPCVPAPPAPPTPAAFLPCASLEGLRGAVVPNVDPLPARAIGVGTEEVFSTLTFRALAATNATPFTVRLAGSMAFTDGAALNAVVEGSNTRKVDSANGNQNITVQTTLRILRQPASLSGLVHTDTDLDGVFEPALGDVGLPNVTVTAVRTDVPGAPVAVLTGPGGHYLFNELEPGIYTVIETQPMDFVDASISLGRIFPTPPPPNPPQPGVPSGATNGFNRFVNIDLLDGGIAVDYNFGENIIPTKRSFVASVDPFREICKPLNLGCRTVKGTAANDTILFAPIPGAVRVTVNGTGQEFGRGVVDVVRIDSGAGNDIVTLNGSSADDIAHLTFDACTIQTGSYTAADYGVVTVNAERTTVDPLLGTDQAIFRDSDQPIADILEIVGPLTTLQWGLVRRVDAMNFEKRRAISVPHVPPVVDNAVMAVGVERVGNWNV
jgi:hypothetical protein